MQVDLFSDINTLGVSRTRSGQIESRKFALGSDLEVLRAYANVYDESKYDSYIKELSELVSEGRHYESIEGAKCDNLAELELLGLGTYTRKYVVCLDFSDALSLAFAVIAGSSQEKIRQLKDYYNVSVSLLNHDVTSKSSTTFKDLFNSDYLIDRYFGKLFTNIYNSGCELNDVVVTQKFYAELLNTISSIKDYVFSDFSNYVKNTYKTELIYRSKTYSKSIGTTDAKIEDVIDVMYNNEVYRVNLSVLEKYEYIKNKVFY